MKGRNLLLGLIAGVGAAIGIRMLTRPSTIAWGDVAGSVHHPEASRFVNVDGIRLHYQEFGSHSNRPIILIHGYTASTYVWRYAAPLLARAGYYVLVPDLVGFGYSEKPRWFEYTIDAQARMLEQFMDSLGVGRAVIAGSSYGGAVAATLALDYAERVEKLILVDAVANDDLMQGPLFRLGSIPGIGEAITMFAASSKPFHRYKMHSTFSPENREFITEERVNAITRPLSSAEAHHSLLATARHWSALRISRDAHLIDQPTLIIWGERDCVIPIETGYLLHERIRGSRMVVFKDTGHVPMEERSGLFTQVVGEFCGAAARSADNTTGGD